MELFSPDGQIKITVNLVAGEFFYRVSKNNHEIIRDSKLGFEFFGVKNHTPGILNHTKGLLRRTNNMLIRTSEIKNHTSTFKMPWGEDEIIANNYNELKITTNRMILTFRAFNDAVAFHYELLPIEHIRRLSVADELTEFNLNQNAICWSIPALEPNRYEYDYEKSSVKNLTHPVHTPFTVQDGDIFLSIHEAALYDYGAMNLERVNNKLKALITPLSDGSKAHVDLPFKTPWRLIMIADSATNLTKNRVMYALNDPPRGDFSWVKTLQFIGIWWAMYVGEYTWAPGEKHGATTAHAKEYIDAATRLGVRGLLIEGWNDGWEGDWLENGAKSDFLRSTPDFDLPAVARYARSKNVELIGHHETVGFVDNYRDQLKPALNFYAANNVHYLKTGYSGSKMNIYGRTEFHHSQVGVKHYQEVVELAAKKHICLDVHEPIKGTGLERTWPNLLTREGARGQEYESGVIRPSHACILPYTRLLAGGMDYTPGLLDLDNKTRPIRTTLARQIALFITIYSGMTMAADRPFIYEQKFPQLFKFIQNIPTTYAKTIPLAGEIGEYYVVARKSKDQNTWFIGGVTNEKARTIKIKFDFLDSGKYQAEIIADDKTAHYETNKFAFVSTKKYVDSTSEYDFFMAPGGGFATKITKIN